MGDKNGEINSIMIPEAYNKYIVSQFMVRKKGDIIRDYRKEPIGFLFMMFSSKEEMKRVLIDEYRCDLVKLIELEKFTASFVRRLS